MVAVDVVLLAATVVLLAATWERVAFADSKRARQTKILRPMGSPLF